MLENSAKDRIDVDGPTLFHTLKMQKRRAARTIQQVRDPLGNIIELPEDTQTFVMHLRKKYKPIAVDSRSIAAMVNAIRPTRPTLYAVSLEQTITPEEIRAALRKGGRNKAPGIDGFGLEFYTTNWETIIEDLHEILNQMFMQKNITTQQKH